MQVANPNPDPWKRFLMVAAGWLFLGVSLLGAVIPILPGWIFFGSGLIILSAEYEWARTLLTRIRARFPRLSDQLDRFTPHWLRNAGEPPRPAFSAPVAVEPLQPAA